MAKAMHVGVSGVARKVSKPFVGVDNVTRKVKKGYVGVSGVAREYYAGLELIEERNNVEYIASGSQKATFVG